jgi:GTPase Era involved in 16S rRNA processing
MASTVPTDIEQCKAEPSPTTEPTDTKDRDSETDLTPSPIISEPQTAPASQHHAGDKVEQNTLKKNRSPVIVLAGKSGVGKSTMSNNLLGLEGEQRCATGDDADPTTREVKICSNTKNDTEVTIVDTPGLGGLKGREVKRILKNISQSTDEIADILLYCISLHPSGRIGAADAEIINTLTKAYGPEIWSRTILALTFANEWSKLTEEAYKRLIEGYARNFQSALRTANIFGIQVQSILTGEEVPQGTIPAVPIGDDPNTPLVVGDDWTNALLKEILKRTDRETAIKLLKFRGYLLPATEVGGCIMTGIAVGTAVGTAAGAPVGVIPGIVVGIPAGAVAGGAIGLWVHRLVPWVHRKYLSRKASKEEGKREAAKREREGGSKEGNGRI